MTWPLSNHSNVSGRVPQTERDNSTGEVPFAPTFEDWRTISGGVAGTGKFARPAVGAPAIHSPALLPSGELLERCREEPSPFPVKGHGALVEYATSSMERMAEYCPSGG